MYEIMHIQESGEMYLETILVLTEKNMQVRAIDIVNHTGYSKPSISRAVGLLKKDGLIEIDQSGHISLTGSGEKIAKRIYERHKFLTDFLVAIGVDKESAAIDACKIEHHISDITFEKIKEYALKGKQKDE